MGKENKKTFGFIQYEGNEPNLGGMDWSNDKLFFTYTYLDETSVYDNHPSVQWMGQCYGRIYKVRIPKAFETCKELRDKFIGMMESDYPNCEGFWVD